MVADPLVFDLEFAISDSDTTLNMGSKLRVAVTALFPKYALHRPPKGAYGTTDPDGVGPFGHAGDCEDCAVNRYAG